MLTLQAIEFMKKALGLTTKVQIAKRLKKSPQAYQARLKSFENPKRKKEFLEQIIEIAIEEKLDLNSLFNLQNPEDSEIKKMEIEITNLNHTVDVLFNKFYKDLYQPVADLKSAVSEIKALLRDPIKK